MPHLQDTLHDRADEDAIVTIDRKDKKLAAAQAIVGEVRRRGGITRSAILTRTGLSKHAVAHAVALGLLVRLRRVWVALPDADPLLIRAAREGVVVSCITEAKRLGLWVLEEVQPHVAVPPHAGMVTPSRMTTHRQAPLVPRHSQDLTDPIENVLALVATCQPFEAALAVWDSAMNKRLVDFSTMSRMPLHGRAKELLAAASPFHDSGLETFVSIRLQWLGLPIIPQAWIAAHRVDFLIGDRLVLQIDGGTHVGAQRDQDIAHDAQLTLMGYHVIRVSYHQVVHQWHTVQDLVARAVAQGLHRAA